MATSYKTEKSPRPDPDLRKGDMKKYQLLWRAGASTGTSLSNRIIIGSDNQKLTTRSQLVKKTSVTSRTKNITTQSENMPVEGDFLQTLLSLGNTHDITLPFNTSICLTQEYTPQITNKIASYATLAGNSVVAFGQGIRKIGMKVTIIKAAPYHIPYTAALEAMTIMSGAPTRYLGGLFLHSFDSANPAAARKYKVVVESLTPVYRSDRNTTIDFDMTLLVAYDYSADRYGRWGRLGL